MEGHNVGQNIWALILWIKSLKAFDQRCDIVTAILKVFCPELDGDRWPFWGTYTWKFSSVPLLWFFVCVFVFGF